MRLTSEFWVTAFMRDVRRQGGFAYLARRGAEEAGAIFIKHIQAANGLAAGGAANGQERGAMALYGPAPQIFYEETSRSGDRLFMRLLTGEGEAIHARLARELDFDPDIWLVEIENFADLTAAGQLRLISETPPV